MSKSTRLLGRLKYVYSHNTKLVLDVSNDDIGLIIEGVEKQIAKKINYVKKYYGSPYQCSICEAEQTKVEFMSTDGSEPKEKHSYCWNCGQKLDWSEVH